MNQCRVWHRVLGDPPHDTTFLRRASGRPNSDTSLFAPGSLVQSMYSAADAATTAAGSPAAAVERAHKTGSQQRRQPKTTACRFWAGHQPPKKTQGEKLEAAKNDNCTWV